MQDIDILEQIIEEKHPKLIIADPYIAFKGGGDSNSADDVRAVLTPLNALAVKHNLAVLGIEHPNKNEKAKASMRSSGSYQSHATVRTKLVVGSDFRTEDPQSRLFGTLKNNWGRRGGTFEYSIDDQGRFSWGAAAPDIRGEQIIETPSHQSSAQRSDTRKTEAAAQIIDGMVPKDGTKVAAKDILAALVKAGISRSTSTRAREGLDVQIFREKRADGTLGPSYWYRALNS
jgi:hypothetical protein